MAARTTPAPAHAPPSWTTRTWMVVRRRRWMWIILDLAGLLVAARAVSGGRVELLNGLGGLRRWSSIWLVPAVAAECCAFIALALAQRRILRAGGVNVGTGPLARLAVTGQAVGSVLPAGYLFSGVVVLRVLARPDVSRHAPARRPDWRPARPGSKERSRPAGCRRHHARRPGHDRGRRDGSRSPAQASLDATRDGGADARWPAQAAHRRGRAH